MSIERIEEKVIENRIGKTPLIQAYELEKYLGISRIYLKLEGNNPSGHREDRLAYLIIKSALAEGKDTLSMGTYGVVGGSLAFLSRFFDINCIFYTPSKKTRSRKKTFIKDSSEEEKIKIIEYGNSYEDCLIKSRRIAEENNWYNANAGLENNVINMCAFSDMANEIARQTYMNVDTIFTDTNNGSSVSGLHLGLVQLWIKNKLSKMPALYGVSTAYGNAIINCYRSGLKTFVPIKKREQELIKKTKYNSHLINRKCQNGQDALNAIYDTNGKAIGLTDEEVIRYYDIIKNNLEGINMSIQYSYPLAAFIKEVESGHIKNGNHVIVLSDAKLDVDIRDISKEDKLPMSVERIFKKIDDWTPLYKDPVIDIEEAIYNAYERGYILCAFYNNEFVGIAIVLNLILEMKEDRYHLAYVGSSEEVKEMSVSTQLLNKAISITDANISLNLNIDNENAVKFYEDMGFEKTYFRMIHKGRI